MHQRVPRQRFSRCKATPTDSPLNPDPFQHWHGIENIARVKINGDSCMALLDNGTQINTIMPKYVSDHLLQMGLITDLLDAKVTCMGLGNAYSRPLGHIIIWVQVDGVQGYDEDQISLVIPDLSNFVAQIPVILGTPTISRVINMMKEVEIDALAMPWVIARVDHLLLECRMMAVKVGDGIVDESSSDNYNQVMFTQNVETIKAFSSHMVLVKVGSTYTGEHINIMAQALWTEDSFLPQSLTVQNMYMELRQGSKKSSHGGKEQYGLPTDPPKENPSGQGSGSASSAQTNHGGSVAGGG